MEQNCRLVEQLQLRGTTYRNHWVLKEKLLFTDIYEGQIFMIPESLRLQMTKPLRFWVTLEKSQIINLRMDITTLHLTITNHFEFLI